MKDVLCNLCRSKDSEIISVINRKPELETDYKIGEEKYYREIRRCRHCDVYFNAYDFKLITTDFYSGFYNASIETGRLLNRFERIINLPYEASDNKQRAKRVFQFIEGHFRDTGSVSLLDVGTGTGVFMHEISKYLTDVSCVDPDPNSISLVKEKVSLRNAWTGTLQNVPIEKKFSVITYNKVLEHVEDPISLLNATRNYLSDDGLIYIELPYATGLIQQNLQDERAEFFIEHFTTFTEKSLRYMISESGLKPIVVNTLIEPSGKHTIYTFANR